MFSEPLAYNTNCIDNPNGELRIQNPTFGIPTLLNYKSPQEREKDFLFEEKRNQIVREIQNKEKAMDELVKPKRRQAY
jgi:hypothetical protein